MLIKLCVLISVLCIFLVNAAPKISKVERRADVCNPEKCKLPNCRCSGTSIPGGLDPKKTPQFVLLTFDDAVTVSFHEYYKQAFYNKKNPDGCPIGVTYFISHEYTDYQVVNELYGRGHEIALHSITHTTLTSHWKNMSVAELKREFGGERDLINKFALIPKEDLKGIRIPFLQLSGDNHFTMIKEEGFGYDCSMPTQAYIEPGLWPYTLDYASDQDCEIEPCPTSSHPGVWVIPMIDWIDEEGVFCAMVDACQNIPNNAEDLFQLIKKNFLYQYNGNRAPFGFYTHAAWFLKASHHFEAYKKFVDYLQTLKDVYIVGASRALQWVKNPKTLDKLKEVFPTCQPAPGDNCPNSKSCRLLNSDGWERYMKVCTANCPNTYPWLDNPLGN